MSAIESGRRYGVNNTTLLLLSLFCLALALAWPFLPIERDPVKEWAGLGFGSVGLVVWAARALRRSDGESFQLDDDALRITTAKWEARVPWSSIERVERRKQHQVAHVALHVGGDDPIGEVRPRTGTPERARRAWVRHCATNRTVFGAPIVLVAWRHGLTTDALYDALRARVPDGLG